jgi:hypothetical protein
MSIPLLSAVYRVSCQSGKREVRYGLCGVLMQLARDLEHSITDDGAPTVELWGVRADPESEEVHDDVR